MSSPIADIAYIQQQINKIRNSPNKEKIGQGAFGDIFVYENNPNGFRIGEKDKFIIKELKKQSDFKYHKNQIQMYSYLTNNNNINTQYYPVFYLANQNEETKTAYIVMEYLDLEEGWGSLAYFYENSLYNDDIINSWYLSVGEILTTLHQNNFIHNDIKCENIMVNYVTGEAKLLDFGLSFLINDESLSTETGLSQIISKLLNQGTPFYMLPLDAFISNEVGKPFILSSIATPNIANGEILKKFAFEKDFFAFKMCFFFRYRMVYPSNWILDKMEQFAVNLEEQSPQQYKTTHLFRCFYKYLLGFPFFVNDFDSLSAIGAFMDETKIDSNVIFNDQNDYFLFMEQVKLFQDEFQYFHRLIV